MMPMPPAFETAEASGERAIQPIGAWTTGISTPRSSVTRFRIVGIASDDTPTQASVPILAARYVHPFLHEGMP